MTLHTYHHALGPPTLHHEMLHNRDLLHVKSRLHVNIFLRQLQIRMGKRYKVMLRQQSIETYVPTHTFRDTCIDVIASSQ